MDAIHHLLRGLRPRQGNTNSDNPVAQNPPENTTPDVNMDSDTDDAMPELQDVSDSSDDEAYADSDEESSFMDEDLPSSVDVQFTPTPPIQQPQQPQQQRPNNRRSRVDEDDDDERDRRHPSQRASRPQQPSQTPQNRPQPPNGPHWHHHPIPGGGIAFHFDMGNTPDTEFGQFMAQLAGLAEAPEVEDPERAKTIVDALEQVPIGLVRRLERVGDVSDSAGNGGDSGCAICWDRLLDGDGDQFGAKDSTAESDSQSHPKIVSLPCAHVFHASCLIPWFSRPRQTTCPTCRFNLDPENLTYRPRALHTEAGEQQPAQDAPPGNLGEMLRSMVERMTNAIPVNVQGPPLPFPIVPQPAQQGQQQQQQQQQPPTQQAPNGNPIVAPTPVQAQQQPQQQPQQPRQLTPADVLANIGQQMSQNIRTPNGSISAQIITGTIPLMAPINRPTTIPAPNPGNNPNRPLPAFSPNFARFLNSPGVQLHTRVVDMNSLRSQQQQLQRQQQTAANTPDGAATAPTNPAGPQQQQQQQQQNHPGRPIAFGLGLSRNLGLHGPRSQNNANIINPANPNPTTSNLANPNPTTSNPANPNPITNPVSPNLATNNPANTIPNPPTNAIPNLPGLHSILSGGDYDGDTVHLTLAEEEDDDVDGVNLMDGGLGGDAVVGRDRDGNSFFSFGFDIFFDPPMVPGAEAPTNTPPPAATLPEPEDDMPDLEPIPDSSPAAQAQAQAQEQQPQTQPQQQQQQQQQQRGPAGPQFRPFDMFSFLGGGPPPGGQAGRPHIHGLPPNFFTIPISTRPTPRNRSPNKKWSLPSPPGPTLRQRIEKKERGAGLRCFSTSCGVGPSDEDPFVVLDEEKKRQDHIHSSIWPQEKVCMHTFHPSCIVSAQRVQLALHCNDLVVNQEKGNVEVECEVCKAPGVVSLAEWADGVKALDE